MWFLLRLDEWRVGECCLIPALQAAGLESYDDRGIAEGPQLSALQALSWNAVVRMRHLHSGMILARVICEQEPRADPGRYPRRIVRQSLRCTG